MAKELPAPHVEANSTLPTTTEYLLHLRCNEATAASTMVDEMGFRTMSVTGSPGVVPSAAQDDPTLGARSFNGSTQNGFRSGLDADQAVFQLAAGGWGVSAWVKLGSLTPEQSVIEFGETLETEVRNVQMRLGIMPTTGAFYVSWEHGAGVSNVIDSPVGVLVVGEWAHIGASMEPDPDNLIASVVRLYVNGECVKVSIDQSWPTGGSSSRWIVGNSRETATYYFNGSMDDVIVTKFPPDVAWFRAQAARGLRDWSQRTGTTLVAAGETFFWSTHVRVLVKVGTTSFTHLAKVDLEWVDLSAISAAGNEPLDFMMGPVSWGDSVDDLIGTGEFSVHRSLRFFNMSPFVEAAAYSIHNPLSDGAGKPLLKAMRRVRFETVLAPAQMRREGIPSWAWEVQFDGFLRSVDVGDDVVRVGCADIGIALLDVFIEPNKLGGDRQYGSSASTAIEGELSQIISDNDPAMYDVLSIDDNGVGAAIIITTFANSTASEENLNGRGRPPTCAVGDDLIITGTVNFNTVAGGTDVVTAVSATTITIARVGGALAAETVGLVQTPGRNSYKAIGRPAIVVPAVSSWTVFEWNEPASKSVLQSLDDIASQIGWRCRFRWHEVRQQFVLTFYDPTLFATSLGASFATYKPNPVLSVGRLSSKVDDMRNTWVGEHANNATKDPQGDRGIYVVAAVNRTSVADYGRRYCRVAVAADSLINRSTEAQNFVDTGLSDMGLPIADMEIETLFDSRVQLADIIMLTSEAVYSQQAPRFFDSAFEGSCVSLRHMVGPGKRRTTIGMRQVTSGTVSALVSRVSRYDEVLAQVGSLPGRGASPPTTPAAPTVINLAAINGNRYIRVSWDIAAGDLNGAYQETEVHISTSSGFTPSAITLTTYGAVVRGTTVVVHGFGVGGTYHVRLVHVDRMGNRSTVSPQTSFVS
jgi:hypothetical protein